MSHSCTVHGETSALQSFPASLSASTLPLVSDTWCTEAEATEYVGCHEQTRALNTRQLVKWAHVQRYRAPTAASEVQWFPMDGSGYKPAELQCHHPKALPWEWPTDLTLLVVARQRGQLVLMAREMWLPGSWFESR